MPRPGSTDAADAIAISYIMWNSPNNPDKDYYLEKYSGSKLVGYQSSPRYNGTPSFNGPPANDANVTFDVDGGTPGPETISFKSFAANEVYGFYTHDWSGKSSGGDWGDTAKLIWRLFSNNCTLTKVVGSGATGSGIYWNIGWLHSSGTFEPNNVFSNSSMSATPPSYQPN